jgi:VanZ family protein
MTMFGYLPPLLQSRGVRTVCLVLSVLLIANLFILGSQPFAAGLIPAPWDKLAHLALFGLLAVLLMVASGFSRPWTVVVMLTLVAAADELHQRVLPGRHADPYDFGTDVAACVAATFVCSVWSRHGRRGR